ncbi:MAG: hypothetical protein JJE42_16645 [Burkholderiales bacterium]|nr:hypothetical protein [Burkholderiales bacterium]
MKPSSIVIALGVAAGIFMSPAMAAGTLLKFDKGIGVDPVAGIANGAPVLNIVKGVNPGGRPWVIGKLKVRVKEDGSISAKGQGLIFSATDNIGTAGAVTQVAASLFCGVDPVSYDSPAAPLDINGNFNIVGSLGSAPPNPCLKPVLLIRNANGGIIGSWFAAAVPGDDSDD